MIKRIGNFEIETFDDGDGVHLVYHHNQHVSDSIDFRGVQDLLDLQYAVSCALRERSDRNK